MLRARQIREEKGLSLEAVVRQTSIGVSNLGRFERGLEHLGLDKLKELAAFYECTIDELVAEVTPQEAPAA